MTLKRRAARRTVVGVALAVLLAAGACASDAELLASVDEESAANLPTAVATTAPAVLATAAPTPTAVALPTPMPDPTSTVAPEPTPAGVEAAETPSPPAEASPPAATAVPAATPAATPGAAPTAPTPAPVTDSQQVLIANGGEVYTLNCARCHGENGMGSAQYSAGLIGVGSRYSAQGMIDELTTGHPVTFGFANRLSPNEIASVVAYVKSVFP